MAKNSIKSGEHPVIPVPLIGGAVRPPQHIEPEFVDCKGLEAGWGIKRSLAYELLNDGKIRSVSLRRRGALRGKRLFSVDSVRAFLHEQMEAGAMSGPPANANGRGLTGRREVLTSGSYYRPPRVSQAIRAVWRQEAARLLSEHRRTGNAAHLKAFCVHRTAMGGRLRRGVVQCLP